jgi:hypothetical protein
VLLSHCCVHLKQYQSKNISRRKKKRFLQKNLITLQTLTSRFPEKHEFFIAAQNRQMIPRRSLARSQGALSNIESSSVLPMFEEQNQKPYKKQNF